MIALPVDITMPAPGPLALGAAVLLGSALLIVVGAYRPQARPGGRVPRRGTFALLLVSIAVVLPLMASGSRPHPATLTIETRPHVAVSPMSHDASRPHVRRRADPGRPPP